MFLTDCDGCLTDNFEVDTKIGGNCIPKSTGPKWYKDFIQGKYVILGANAECPTEKSVLLPARKQCLANCKEDGNDLFHVMDCSSDCTYIPTYKPSKPKTYKKLSSSSYSDSSYQRDGFLRKKRYYH